ncbi:MAG: hypothetical protein K2Z80_05275 [Xanthobacteraceae bacterium]|nr:hypothetical protein [Xanthobacteraceae bacterium]
MAASIAVPASAQVAEPGMPNGMQLLMMIKTTLIAYSQANTTGNYSVLRDLAAPAFQQVNSVARLSEIFRDERSKNLDLSPVVLLRPELLRPVVVDDNGLLNVEGYFPSKPQMVHFKLVFQSVAQKWRLVALGVTTVSATPMAANDPKRENPAARPAEKAKVTAGEFVQNWAGNWPALQAGFR